MIQLYAILLIPPLLALACGYLQIRRGGYNHFTVMLMVALLAALGCWMIGASKAGDFLSGIVGMALAGVMGLVAGGLALGGVGAWLAGRDGRMPVAPGGSWLAVAVICAMAALALVASLLEYTVPAPDMPL